MNINNIKKKIVNFIIFCVKKIRHEKSINVVTKRSSRADPMTEGIRGTHKSAGNWSDLLCELLLLLLLLMLRWIIKSKQQPVTI